MLYSNRPGRGGFSDGAALEKDKRHDPVWHRSSDFVGQNTQMKWSRERMSRANTSETDERGKGTRNTNDRIRVCVVWGPLCVAGFLTGCCIEETQQCVLPGSVAPSAQV